MRYVQKRASVACPPYRFLLCLTAWKRIRVGWAGFERYIIGSKAHGSIVWPVII